MSSPNSQFMIDTTAVRSFLSNLRSQVSEGHLAESHTVVTNLVDEVTSSLDASRAAALSDSTTAVRSAIQSVQTAIESFCTQVGGMCDEADSLAQSAAQTFRSITTQ